MSLSFNISSIPNQELEILQSALFKAKRYHNAINDIHANKLCAEHLQAKEQFKTITQACLRNGINVPSLLDSLLSLDISAQDPNCYMEGKNFYSNLKAKITRYNKKIEKSQSAFLATKEEFIQVTQNLKKAFDAVHNDPVAHQTFREFRISKKGLKDDQTKYVGFFKFLKKNKAVFQKNGEIFKNMCIEANLTNNKIYKKILRVCSPVTSFK